MTEDGNIIEFLLGEKSFNGWWYGEQIGNTAPFWWRRELRKEIAEKDRVIAELNLALNEAEKKIKQLDQPQDYYS